MITYSSYPMCLIPGALTVFYLHLSTPCTSSYIILSKIPKNLSGAPFKSQAILKDTTQISSVMPFHPSFLCRTVTLYYTLTECNDIYTCLSYLLKSDLFKTKDTMLSPMLRISPRTLQALCRCLSLFLLGT